MTTLGNIMRPFKPALEKGFFQNTSLCLFDFIFLKKNISLNKEYVPNDMHINDNVCN